jgi:hypothetical protein
MLSNRNRPGLEDTQADTAVAQLGSKHARGYTEEDRRDMQRMGKTQELRHVYQYSG